MAMILSPVLAKDVKDERDQTGSAVKSQGVNETDESSRERKVSGETPKETPAAHEDSKHKEPRSVLNYGRQPDSRLDSKLRSIDRINRSFNSSMKSIDNSIRKMNTDVNRIRTLDRRF